MGVIIVNMKLLSNVLYLDSVKGTLLALSFMGIRDDLLRAMKNGEVALIVLANFFKALQTVRYKKIRLITKLFSIVSLRPFSVV